MLSLPGMRSFPEVHPGKHPLAAPPIVAASTSAHNAAVERALNGLWMRDTVIGCGVAETLSLASYSRFRGEVSMKDDWQEDTAFKRVSDGTGLQEPRGCLFIHGNVKDGGWRYCQAPRRHGSSYCDEHHAVTHLPPEQFRPLMVDWLCGDDGPSARMQTK